MQRLLEGQVALITGGGRGVGRGIALAMAQAGAKVVVNDLGATLDGQPEDAQPAKAVVAEIEAMGGQAIVDGGSVADWNDAHRMVQSALDTFGRIDIVVNNAGILRDAMFHRMSELEFDAVVAVHLKGSFNVSRAAAPHFKAQGSGCYVHMTSLSKSIALDMQKFGVRSNAVAPVAWTRMIDSIPSETPEQKKRVDGLKQLVPERVAPFVVGLCTDEAKDVTGQIFGVRNNEIFVFSQPRPVRSVHRGEGWSPESVVATALPMLRAGFSGLDRSSDVFTWDPA